MIVGVGIDLVEIARVERMIVSKGDRALRRLFTEREASYALARPDPFRHLAARIAAKEAAYKALAGTERARGIGWREIEVIRSAGAPPSLALSGLAAERASELGACVIRLALTHSAVTAAAVAIAESDDGPALR
ncbi:MAG: holo-ACP synthase [Gemmatimonadaceae bacterium]